MNLLNVGECIYCAEDVMVEEGQMYKSKIVSGAEYVAHDSCVETANKELKS